MQLTLTKLPWYAQVGAFVALAVRGLRTFYYYYEMPVRADIDSASDAAQALRADITKGLTTAKKLPEFRQRGRPTSKAGWRTSRRFCPRRRTPPICCNRMQTVAAQSNMTIKGFKPSPTVTKQLHAEWPIALELEGTYHNLAIFFDRVGKFTRIVNISGLDVKGKDKPDPNTTITATCVATTFVLLDKPAPAPAKPGAPAAAAPPAKGN